jgi:peptidoglycan/xylan/chitin deacetylase (PgdA/CDA1 family)
MTILQKVAHHASGSLRFLPGSRRVARRVRKRSVSILMYHGVTCEPLTVPNWCQLAVDEFERQMEFLSAEYQVLPLREVIGRLEGGRVLPDHTACITFDDGFRNVSTTAFPVLRRLGLAATVFLVTESLETAQPAWPDRLFFNLASTPRTTIDYGGREFPLQECRQRFQAYGAIAGDLKKVDNAVREDRMADLIDRLGKHEVPRNSAFAPMRWDEVEGLSASGIVDFGSHTHTHPILSRCPVSRQVEELRRSRDILRDHLGRADLFAYPNGTSEDFTPDTKRILEDLGYRCGLATISGLNHPRSDRFEWHRVNIGADVSAIEFELLLLGL